jgi:hypothetical protein
LKFGVIINLACAIVSYISLFYFDRVAHFPSVRWLLFIRFLPIFEFSVPTMQTLTIQIENESATLWQTLPIEAQKILTSGAISSLLNGKLYPTGTEQLELAIVLAENGVQPETISLLTRLDREVFEAFLK